MQLYDGKGPLRTRLKNVLKVYNSVKHSGTGLTPNECLNPDLWDMVKRKQYEERLEKYKRFAKPKRLSIFKEGENVLVQTDIIIDKQDPKYILGGVVKRVLENDTYEVLINGKIQKRYSSQLRRY